MLLFFFYTYPKYIAKRGHTEAGQGNSSIYQNRDHLQPQDQQKFSFAPPSPESLLQGDPIAFMATPEGLIKKIIAALNAQQIDRAIQLIGRETFRESQEKRFASLFTDQKFSPYAEDPFGQIGKTSLLSRWYIHLSRNNTVTLKKKNCPSD